MTNTKNRSRYRIAVDVMGGDHAPTEIILGALDAVSLGGVEVMLVGDLEAVNDVLPSSSVPDFVHVVPSEGVITENDHPLETLRSKPKASIIVTAGLVKNGIADAYVTMGSTGAAMAAGVVALGNLDGIDRPALGGPFLGLAPDTVLVDLGTSLDNRPSQLLNYGILGSVFAKVFMGIDNPSVALLSVGTEDGKGNRQVREAHELFRKSTMNFIGNVEGVDIPLGKANVVVCDGFVGNVLMKFTEGLGIAVVEYLKSNVPGEYDKITGELLGKLYDLTNHVEHVGGGPLLGLNGVAIVGHGRSRARSVTAAIDLARVSLERGLIDSMKRELADVRSNVKGHEEM